MFVCLFVWIRHASQSSHCYQHRKARVELLSRSLSRQPATTTEWERFPLGRSDLSILGTLSPYYSTYAMLGSCQSLDRHPPPSRDRLPLGRCDLSITAESSPGQVVWRHRFMNEKYYEVKKVYLCADVIFMNESVWICMIRFHVFSLYFYYLMLVILFHQFVRYHVLLLLYVLLAFTLLWWKTWFIKGTSFLCVRD